MGKKVRIAPDFDEVSSSRFSKDNSELESDGDMERDNASVRSFEHLQLSKKMSKIKKDAKKQAAHKITILDENDKSFE